MSMDAASINATTGAGFMNTSTRQTATRASGNIPPDPPSDKPAAMDSGTVPAKKAKLGAVSGVFIPTVLNILSILMFLRFGSILGRIGLLGILGLLIVAYFINLVTALSLSAIASNGEVKGGGAYYLISRSLGPEFGGSIGVLFYLSQVLNTALNVVGLIDCLKLNLGNLVPPGYWSGYLLETCALVACTALCLAGSAVFSRASNGLLAILVVATLSIPLTAMVKAPFKDSTLGVEFTGISSQTFVSNLYPASSRAHYKGMETFRELFGILFPATSGIFAGASMSGDLRNPSKAIPKGTVSAALATLALYLVVILSMASSITHGSFLHHTNIVSTTSLWSPLILAGECATTFFSALMGLVGSAKLLQALARDKLLPGLSVFGMGTKRADDPIYAVLITYLIAQVALFADLNQIATLISMGYQMTFFVMNLACFLLKIGSAPNFRPAFKFFNWQSAFIGSVLSGTAMFFIDETYAASAVCLLVFLFLLIHFLSPPKHWGDVSQNLIYHQVRKYLLRLKPEHIKFWRPQIIVLINDPRHHTRLIQFCNSLKKGSLYILGHVIVTDDFGTGIHEAKLQQAAWTKYITEYSRIKAFVQLTMSPTIEWGVRNLILSAGLGGMRPNIVVLGFYNMDDFRKSQPSTKLADVPSPIKRESSKSEGKVVRRRRGDTTARLLAGALPTDAIRTEGMLSATSYMTILEDLALRNRLNVAIGKGFQTLESPRRDGANTKKFIDLWPIQMSAEITSQGQSVLTTNFDTYTLILQLGYILSSVPTWKAAYALRILVFVEYESEVEEEKARLKALLDKLRIQAQVHVFWLASGDLTSYENIVNGRVRSQENERIVNELLKDNEWWQELQRIRHQDLEMSQSQAQLTLEEILEATKRRGSNPSTSDEVGLRRKLSMQELLGLKKPTVSKMSRLGVNFGIRTQHLESDMLNNQVPRQEYDYSADDSDSSSSSDIDFNETASIMSEGDADYADGSRQPLLHSGRRRSQGRRSHTSRKSEKVRDQRSREASEASVAAYGTMTSTSSVDQSTNVSAQHQLPESSQTSTYPEAQSGRRSEHRRHHSRQASGSLLLRATHEPSVPEEEDPRPAIQIQAPEGSGAAKPGRPPMSRASSFGRFSSRPVPETKIEDEDGGGQRLTFAEPECRPITRTHTPMVLSRRNSTTQRDTPAEPHLNIPELLESYHFNPRTDTGGRSSYSAQSLPLSFNDLPSRAQHLILNDLMRQNSSDTAVLLTTLPIPEEGTSKSEEASIRFLSDIELLCHELPPVLLVLSNNMTVTVSL